MLTSPATQERIAITEENVEDWLGASRAACALLAQCGIDAAGGFPARALGLQPGDVVYLAPRRAPPEVRVSAHLHTLVALTPSVSVSLACPIRLASSSSVTYGTRPCNYADVGARCAGRAPYGRAARRF